MTTSAARAFDILDEVVGRSEPAGLMELAAATGLDKSTASRLLALLCDRGLVARDPATRRYEPGPSLLLLGTRVLDGSMLRATAHSHMQRLRDLSGETVTLQLRVGLQRVCIDGVESLQLVRRVIHIGEANPLYIGVSGKVITAFLQPAWRLDGTSADCPGSWSGSAAGVTTRASATRARASPASRRR
jgi:IclR family transcriptional regulator, KDG regulon repressor